MFVLYTTFHSTYFLNYKIDRGVNEGKELYWFNEEQLNLLTQLCILSYWNKKTISGQIDSVNDFWSNAECLNKDSQDFVETVYEKSSSPFKFLTFLKGPRPTDESDLKQQIAASTQGFMICQLKKFENEIDINELTKLRIYIMFRGTELKLEDMLLNSQFQYCMVSYPYDKIRVHNGFLHGYYSIKDEMMRVICKTIKNYDKIGAIEFFIGGHSLGGAIGHIAAMDLREELTKQRNEELLKNKIVEIRLFTIGPPMVGDISLYRYFEKYRSGWHEYWRDLKNITRYHPEKKIYFDHLRSRHDMEFTGFLPPIGYKHTLPAIFWTNDGKPKYHTYQSKYVLQNLYLASFYHQLGKIVQSVVKLYKSETDIPKIAQSIANLGSGLLSESNFDHAKYNHLRLILSLSQHRIYFPKVKQELDAWLSNNIGG